MKRMMKIIYLTLAVIILLGNFASCETKKDGSGVEEEKNTQQLEETTKESKNGILPFDIEQLEWKVAEGIIDGERSLSFQYVNNSNVSILSLKISFREKRDLKPEEKKALIDYLIAAYELDEEESSALQVKELSMVSCIEQLVKKGEKSDNGEINYYEEYSPKVERITHYDLVEPDIATICYVFDGKICVGYYDFVEKNYSKEDKTEPAFYWTDSVMGTKIPKPKAEVVEKYLLDSDTSFSVKVWGINYEDYEKYREECIQMGLNVNSTAFDDFYAANNLEGDYLVLNYEEDDHTMTISISTEEI